jgi:hypothetical protein
VKIVIHSYCRVYALNVCVFSGLRRIAANKSLQQKGLCQCRKTAGGAGAGRLAILAKTRRTGLTRVLSVITPPPALSKSAILIEKGKYHKREKSFLFEPWVFFRRGAIASREAMKHL